MKTLRSWLAAGIFLLALAVRLAGNTFSPPSPYWEEAALGYDAYSILQTGRDHHGNFLPVVAFPSFGDFKPSLYFYALVPSVALFGLNTFAVRLPAALASAGAVWLLYLLLKRWAGEKPALWAAAVLIVQPWSWQVGRVGFETNLATFLLLAGVLLLSEAVEYLDQTKDRRVFWLTSIGAAGSFALSMYTYHGARLLAPLFALTVFLLNLPRITSKNWRAVFFPWFPAIVVAVVMVFPIFLALRSPIIQQRFTETSIFSLSEPVERSNQWREIGGDTLINRALSHRYWFWTEEIVRRYTSHFSPQFLFGRGDANPRHTSQLFGALYPWELLTLLLGLAYGAKRFRNRKHWYTLLVLAALSPVAAALTLATPHALRTLPLSPWLAGLSGLGLLEAIEFGQKSVKRLSYYIPFIGVGLLTLSWFVLAFYFHSHYRLAYAGEWQYGYQELFDKLSRNRQENEPVFVSRAAGRPAMYLFFTQRIDPRLVQAEEDSAPKDQQERLTFQDWSFVDGSGKQPGLHAVTTQEFSETEAEVVDEVRGLDDSPVWVIYRY